MVNNNTMHNARIIGLSFIGSSLLFAASAWADVKLVQQQHVFQKTHLKTESPVAKDKPVLLTADTVDYDQQDDIIIASGHVEIAQGDTVVLADQVTYDRNKNEVQAEGDVSMMGPTGEVYFADKVVFEDDLSSGTIEALKGRLADDSVVVASDAAKRDENITELFKAAYTPCNCKTENGEPKTPIWSIKADKATIDEGEQEMRYENATLNFYDFPILYTPYFSHALPGAENESGLLTPEIIDSHNLGVVYRQPVYYSIGPDKDATFTPILTTHAGEVLAVNYRQMFDPGLFEITGSLAEAPNHDSLGNPAPGNETRGHIDAKGLFNITPTTDWGFNIRRASDDTYLHLYDFSGDTVLTSRIYAENFNFIGDNGRTYASIEGLSFQDLTAQESSKDIPIVAPLVNFTWQSDPRLFDSRLGFDANTMVLYRDVGADSRRLSTTAHWDLPYISDDGQVIQINTQMRTDIYDVDNVTMDTGRTFDGVTGRAVPQISGTWRYPFINRMDDSSLLIEPVGNLTISPGGGNPQKIPNEDSLLPDFTDANLFSSDRFAGLDRIENGPRFSYGMRGQAQLFTDKYVDWLLGQQYRVTNDPNFPISNDPNSHLSDYVGKVGFTYHPLSLVYRFRVDKDNLSPHRSEVDAGYNEYPLSFNASYLDLKNDPILANRQVVTGTATVNMTKEWSFNVSGSRDLLLDQTVTTYSGVTYKNECVSVAAVVGKDYTNLLDIEPSLTFWLRISLKNLE